MSCSQRCKMCYLYGESSSYMKSLNNDWKELMHSYLEINLFYALVDCIAEHNPTCSFFLMGGEPMLHPDIITMNNYIKKHMNSYVDINTNGLANEAKYLALIDSGIDRIIFSIESSFASEHDAIRGIGSYNKAIRCIEVCREYIDKHNLKTQIALNTTLQPENYSHINTIISLLVNLGIDNIYMNYPMYVTEKDGLLSRDKLIKELGITFDSWMGFLHENRYCNMDSKLLKFNIQQLKKSSIDFTLVPNGFSDDQLEKYFTDKWSDLVANRTCPSINYRTTVLPNGDVIPCTVFTDIIVGNIKEKDIYSIWNGKKYQSFRDLLGKQILPMCYRCCDMLDESDGNTFSAIT